MDSLSHLKDHIARELREDRYFDDVTTRLLAGDAEASCIGRVRAKQAGVFFGATVVMAFRELFPEVSPWRLRKQDGDLLAPGDTVLSFRAARAACLTLERTLLNYLSLGCGVATATSQFVRAVEGLPARILATRKTLPGLRDFQLAAVRAGGGYIHRRSLSDGILIKDNHQEVVSAVELIRRARLCRSPLHRVEVEVQDLKALEDLMKFPPDVIMLDNLSLEEMRHALEIINGRAQVEVSGGVTLEQVRSVAELGVDYISVGRLTHSAPGLDLSLDLLAKDGA